MMTLQVNENIQAAIQKGTWARFLVNNIIFKDTDFKKSNFDMLFNAN